MTEEKTLLRGGRSAAERVQAEKAEREKRRGSAYNTYDMLRLAAPADGELYGESVIVRMVTDEPEWLEVKQHQFVNTKPAPKDKPSDKKFPAQMGAVCRYTMTENGPWFDDCIICDLELAKKSGKNGEYIQKPGTRLWAVAVEREEVEVDGEITYQDVMVDQEVDGKTTQIPHFFILNFAMDNFFDYFLGFNNVYKTVRDRDYRITRTGKGTDTDYSVVALDPITEVVDGKIKKVVPEYEVPFDLFEIVKEQASDRHYNWFFNPGVKSSWVEHFGAPKDKSESGGGSAPAADPERDEKNKETLEAVRQRLLDSKAKQKANA